MIMPPALLVVAAIVVGLLPHLGPVVQTAAVRFQDQHAYNAAVLSGVGVAHPVALYPAESTGGHAGRRRSVARARRPVACCWPPWPCTGGASRCFAAALGPTWCWPAQSGGSRAGSSTTTSPGS